MKYGYYKYKIKDNFERGYMNILKKGIAIIFLLTILAYTTNITAMPKNLLLFKGEELILGEMFGIYIKEENNEVVQTSATLNNVEIMEKSTLKLRLFNIINVKEIELDTIPVTAVVPLGNTIRT